MAAIAGAIAGALAAGVASAAEDRRNSSRRRNMETKISPYSDTAEVDSAETLRKIQREHERASIIESRSESITDSDIGEKTPIRAFQTAANVIRDRVKTLRQLDGNTPFVRGSASHRGTATPNRIKAKLDYSEALAMEELLNEKPKDFGSNNWRIRELLENPDSSKMAYIFAVGVLVLIVVSSCFFVSETVEQIQGHTMNRIFGLSDVGFISIFTVEYIVRLLVAPQGTKRQFLTATMNVIDLVAFLPFYVEVLMSSMGWGQFIDLRFLRLARVFRVFKLSRYSSKMTLVTDALKESRDILAMIFLNVFILVVVFSSIVFYAEKNQEDTAFTSIPHTCWWCVVTVLTVGYGEMVPETLIGKLVASVLMCCSLVVMALPTTIIGSAFSTSWILQKKEMKIKERHHTMPEDFRSVFVRISRFVCDWEVYNDTFQSENQQLQATTLELRESLRTKNYGKLRRLLPLIVKEHKLLELHRHESQRKTNRAFEQLIIDIVRLLGVTRTQMALSETNVQSADVLMRVAMEEMLKNRKEVSDIFDLKENQTVDAVCILHVIGAKDLMPLDVNGSSDPYLMIQHGKYEKQYTQDCQKSLHPLWDEHKIVLLRNFTEPINFHVFDKDRSIFSLGGRIRDKHEKLGRAALIISGLSRDVVHSVTLPLTGKGVSGDIRISVLLKHLDDISSTELQDPNVWKLFTRVGAHFHRVFLTFSLRIRYVTFSISQPNCNL